MNRLLTTTVGCSFALVALPTLAIAQAGGFTTLFDGSSLDGWRVLGNANWELSEGAVSANSGNGFLVSEESYGDFELSLEFWVDTPANSGIFIRCSDPQSVNDRNSYEVNIYDTRADQTYRTGGIVHLAAPSAVINSGGQWNTYQITALGISARCEPQWHADRRYHRRSVYQRPDRASVRSRHRPISQRPNPVARLEGR